MSLLVENRPGPPLGTSGPGRTAGAPPADAFATLIGGLTHDFNNLFGLIIGNLELLRDSRTTPQESLDFSRDALEAAMRGAELTRDLVAFAQHQRLDPRPIEINAFVTEIAERLTARLGERIAIVLDLAPELSPVIADPVQLESALVSLATSAAAAMPKGGRLEIATA